MADKKNGVFISDLGLESEFSSMVMKNLEQREVEVHTNSKKLKNSKAGIIIYPDEEVRRGQNSLDLKLTNLIKAMKVNLEFHIIMIVQGESYPEYKDVSVVDFSNPAQFIQNLENLLETIGYNKTEILYKNDKISNYISLKKVPDVASYPIFLNEKDIIQESILLFQNRQSVILLDQQKRIKGKVKDCLLKKSNESELGRVYDISFYNSLTSLGEYFQFLEQQCSIKPEKGKPLHFRTQLEERLKSGNKIFLLITEFDKGCEEGRQEFAGILRALTEKSSDIRLLICGGETLEEFYFKGELSYLNRAKVMEWPDPTVGAIVSMAADIFPDLNVNESLAQDLLQLSGGHLEILDICFKIFKENKKIPKDLLISRLASERSTVKLFKPFSISSEKNSKICTLLKNNDLGPALTYIKNPLKRRLFWHNLLKNDGSKGRLYWRCEALCEAGNKILECDSNED